MYRETRLASMPHFLSLSDILVHHRVAHLDKGMLLTYCLQKTTDLVKNSIGDKGVQFERE